MANVAAVIGSGRIQLIGDFSPSRANTTFIPTAIIGNKDIGPGPKLSSSSRMALMSPSPVERGPWDIWRLTPLGKGKVEPLCKKRSATLKILRGGSKLVPLRETDEAPTNAQK